MKYFSGTYKNKIDSKGRVSLPAPFRNVLKQGDALGSVTDFYIFHSPQHDALEAGGSAFMEIVNNGIAEHHEMFSKEEDILLYIMRSAKLVSCDITGRFVLPSDLANIAGIDHMAIFTGSGRRFQIWSPEQFSHRAAQEREKFNTSGLSIKIAPRIDTR